MSVKLEGTITYVPKKKEILRILVKKLLHVHMSIFFVLKQFEHWTITKQVWHIVMYLLRAQVWPWFFIPFSDFFAIRDKRHTIYHTYPSAVDTLLYFQEMLKCNIHDLSCNYIALNVWGRDNNKSWICCQ